MCPCGASRWQQSSTPCMVPSGRIRRSQGHLGRDRITQLFICVSREMQPLSLLWKGQTGMNVGGGLFGGFRDGCINRLVRRPGQCSVMQDASADVTKAPSQHHSCRAVPLVQIESTRYLQSQSPYPYSSSRTPEFLNPLDPP